MSFGKTKKEWKEEKAREKYKGNQSKYSPWEARIKRRGGCWCLCPAPLIY